MQNLWKVGKIAVEFEIVCGSKFMTFWDDVGRRPPVVVNALNRLSYIMFHSEDICR